MSISTFIRRTAIGSLCCAVLLTGLTAAASAQSGSAALRNAEAQQAYYASFSEQTVPDRLAAARQQEQYLASYGRVKPMRLGRVERTSTTHGAPSWILPVALVGCLVLLVSVSAGARSVRRRHRTAALA